MTKDKTRPIRVFVVSIALSLAFWSGRLYTWESARQVCQSLGD